MTRNPVCPPAAVRLAAALLLAASFAHAAPAAPEGPRAVKVERVRPARERHETLRFLRSNRDFLRGELDRLRDRAITGAGGAAAMDPRFLAYRALLAQSGAAGDSAARAEEARGRRELYASVTQLGELETQLDQMDRALAAQRDRLGVLQDNFTGDQRTALAVVLSGWPAEGGPSQVSITLDDGTTLAIPISEPQRDALRHGGVLKVFHRFVEPREQVVDVALSGFGWNAPDHGYITLEPARDRLLLLKLDLASLVPADGAGSLTASTWLHDDRTP